MNYRRFLKIKNNSFFKFIVIGVIASAIHWCISFNEFYSGASSPPALLFGMAVAALVSYLMTRCFVFRNFSV